MTRWKAQLSRIASRPVREGFDIESDPALDLYASSRAVPAAILSARGTGDVQAAVATAAEHDVPLSIRGGGHSGAGFAARDNGLMLDLSELRGVQVDPARQVAWAEAGATWGDYDRATQGHGLASTGGIVSSTGVAGLTLGGGIGALRGLHGLAVDNLSGADVVLADGRVVRADPDHNPDLFWALRGGGGNFGVVIRFEFNIHPVAQLTTGLLGWPIERAQDVAAAYRSQAGALADDTVAELVFTHDGGQNPTLFVIPRVIGDAAAAAPLIKRLSDPDVPTTNTLATRSYTDGQSFMDAMARWGQRVYWNTITLRHIDEEVVAVLVDFTRRAPSRASAINVEHLHGEVSRRDPDSTAVGFRHAPYNVFIEAKWDEPGADADNRAWARELVAALAPYSAGGAYVNYLPRDADHDRIRHAYGDPTYERLRVVKAAYDPDNLLRANQNIPPADLSVSG